MGVKLYPHQEEALRAMHGQEGFALFFDMGTGKTLTAIRDMEERFSRGLATRALVLCPLSVVHAWIDEIGRFSPLSARAVRGTLKQREDALSSEAQVLVMNYDLLHKYEKQLAGVDYIVADESQRLISPKARWTKAALRLAKSAKTRRILTGTPIRNWPIDLYNQMKFINPSILPWRSHFAFRKEFAIELNMGGFSKIIGVRNEDDIRQRCAPFVRYVTFDDAIKGMPEWVEQVRTVELNADQKRAYKELSKDLLTKIGSGLVTAQNAAIQMLRLSQIAGGTLRDVDGKDHRLGTRKLDELKDIIASGHKGIVVWCKFVEEIKWLGEELDAPVIYGAVDDKDRRRILTEFEAGKHQVLIAQVQTLAEGVNELKNADVEVRWSYDFSYVTYVQSRARMRRSGRDMTKPCLSIQLVSEGTTDMKVIEAVKRKEGVALNTLEEIRRIVG